MTDKHRQRADDISEEREPTQQEIGLDDEMGGHDSSPEDISPYSTSDEDADTVETTGVEEDLNDSPSRHREQNSNKL